MIFRRKKSSGLADTLTELEQGAAARDGERTERAFAAAVNALQAAGDAECVAAGPRLAALLPQFPPVGPRSVLATAAGFCVERGADAGACAGPILADVRDELAAALRFAAAWRATGADELPEPDEELIDEALLARLGGDQYEALRLARAWCTIEQWQAPALAVLCRSTEVRRRHRAELLPLCRELEVLGRHDLKCLSYALAVLDDEPVVVLHRPTGTGYQVRIGGIGDNFQLHTLLAHLLIGGGHLPGTAPSADSVRLATDPAPADGTRSGIVATGSFTLLAPDGGRIWNEGLPDDIPEVDGHRLLVLDDPQYPHGWNADRFFPLLPGRAELVRVLPADETRDWFARTTA
ncbi:hypothetical protein [Kitasatospora cheerisanensis]|uniref:Uncharacterized protein n=1 Tax=Kitasatospora cheerisanensis KCTC 2395 TaxID=1348663 RepID=A0A066Z2R3_9ACTN|nr:hypothetical protein [Kitasatospora cheerisanensis]KDN88068.1 hypothetical protein KCH_01450 [Kitasatospora cheerisanensis KCTC 2395]